MAEEEINNQEVPDQSSTEEEVEDENVPLHKTKRFQELRSEVSESKQLIEQQTAALAEMQSAVTKLATAKTETERNSIVDNLLKDLDAKAGELTPSQLYRELDKVRKAEEAQVQEEKSADAEKTAQETLADFNQLQTIEGLSETEISELGEWMLEKLNANGDKKIYSDPLRSFHLWDKARQVEIAAKASQEDKKSRSGVGPSSPSTGEKVKISFEELRTMSRAEAKRRSIGA